MTTNAEMDAKVLRLKEMNHALEEDNGILNSEIKALREKIDAMRANFTTQSWKIERLKADLEKEKKECGVKFGESARGTVWLSGEDGQIRLLTRVEVPSREEMYRLQEESRKGEYAGTLATLEYCNSELDK